MTRAEAAAYAEGWASEWNRRDLEAILAHFDDGIVFTSPKAIAVTGSATVRGKLALRSYWERALTRIGSLRFEIRRIVWDPTTRDLAILYDRQVDGQQDRVAEVLRFNANGKLVEGEVLYGALAPNS